MSEVFRAPDLRTLYKAPATGNQGGKNVLGSF
nr:MAG TPA: hypothetical protein [Caudoviricetes sp.]